VIYEWKWYYGVPALAPWAVLILAILLVRANRQPRVLLLLIPLLIVHLLWLLFMKLMQVPSSARFIFDQIFTCFVVGFTLLWLLTYQLGNRNRFVSFLLALLIMLVIGLLGTVSYTMAFSDETMQMLVFLSMLAVALLLGFALAGWRCREHYSPVRFMLWLAAYTVGVGAGVMLIFAFVMALLMGDIPPLLQVLIVGLVCGLCVYALELPYMILAFCSSFFRERFYACLHLKSMSGASREPNPA